MINEEDSYIDTEESTNTVKDNKMKEVGELAAWTLSSAKSGNGVAQLRDNETNTYWQSDGQQPHTIHIQFPEYTEVSVVAFYLDFGLDESYTPKKIRFRHGNTFHDLEEFHTIELHQPSGWVHVNVGQVIQKKNEVKFDLYPEERTFHEDTKFRTFFLQIEIVEMHQNGRDTHIRQVKVYSSNKESAKYLTRKEGTNSKLSSLNETFHPDVRC
eukprot:augustus_masked-scaffold_5-processed-gene-14.7-mRNA-1 protein AED:0.02 eAED:0.02 QI:0/-1/0/1/-1/1/1/0/212